MWFLVKVVTCYIKIHYGKNQNVNFLALINSYGNLVLLTESLSPSTLTIILYRGVDDILPILSYIIIRTGLPQLVSECALMEEFIQDG